MATGNWKDEEVLRLIDVWGDDVIQSQLEGCKRNKQIYDGISKDLLAYGVQRSAEECREKMKKLKSEYRKVKDGHRVTGNKCNNWKFLEPLYRILADKPSTKPTILVDTLTIHSDENLQHDSSASSTENTSLNDTSSASSTETRMNTSIESLLPDCEEVHGPTNDSVGDSTKLAGH